MNSEQLFKDTQAFVKAVQPIYDIRGYVEIGSIGVGVYVDSERYTYLSVKILGGGHVEYTISKNHIFSPDAIALAYAILAVAKARTENFVPEPVEPVEVTLEDVARLKGVDVARIRIVEDEAR